MLFHFIRALRTTFQILWVALVGALLVALVANNLMPLLGHQLFVVRGGSMEPTIPLGSAVVVGRVSVDQLALGDVVTFRGANDTVITHRLVGLPTADDANFHTKGDAVESPDFFATAPSAVVGRVEVVIPVAGMALISMASTIGSLLTLGVLAILLLSIWFLDELAATLRRSSVRGAAAELVT
jgi:signal peptidase I